MAQNDFDISNTANYNSFDFKELIDEIEKIDKTKGRLIDILSSKMCELFEVLKEIQMKSPYRNAGSMPFIFGNDTTFKAGNLVGDSLCIEYSNGGTWVQYLYAPSEYKTKDEIITWFKEKVDKKTAELAELERKMKKKKEEDERELYMKLKEKYEGKQN